VDQASPMESYSTTHFCQVFFIPPWEASGISSDPRNFLTFVCQF
jgi:hypothetical protein